MGPKCYNMYTHKLLFRYVLLLYRNGATECTLLTFSQDIAEETSTPPPPYLNTLVMCSIWKGTYFGHAHIQPVSSGGLFPTLSNFCLVKKKATPSLSCTGLTEQVFLSLAQAALFHARCLSWHASNARRHVKEPDEVSFFDSSTPLTNKSPKTGQHCYLLINLIWHSNGFWSRLH